MKKERIYFYEMKQISLNILTTILFIALIILTFLIKKDIKISIDYDINLFYTTLLLIPYFILHEILHAIGYIINGAKFKNITFGIHLEKSVFCCSCKQNINKKTVLWSLAFPFLFIGVVTYIIGIIFNKGILIALSIANLSGCSGDLIMFWNFLKIKNFKFFEYDNPVGFGVITNENLENRNFWGLKQLDEKNFTQTINKKISVSKISIIILLIYFIIIFLPIILSLLFNIEI